MVEVPEYPASSETKARLVNMANANAELFRLCRKDHHSDLDAHFAFIKPLIDKHEVVFGVYLDDTRSDGVGLYIIKGKARVTDEGFLWSEATAIACESWGDADALNIAHGDGDGLADVAALSMFGPNATSTSEH